MASKGAGKDKAAYDEVMRTLVFMALTHTIVIDTSTGGYSAASPDELALVNAAKQLGVEFKDIDSDNNLIITVHGKMQKYKKLDVCEFNSTRKRMSVIFEDPDGTIVLRCKGADSVIAERLSAASKRDPVYLKNTEFVETVACDGLRTLFLAEKVLDKGTFNTWYEKKKEAMNVVDGREAAVMKVDEEIEKEMELIGTTAIEDKLQDQVADAIKFMKRAGIKVWVLTGDKIGTAKNIGTAAGLLDRTMTQYEIRESDGAEDLGKQLKAMRAQCEE